MVMLGQPARPLGHLVKASGFWTLVIWVVVGLGPVSYTHLRAHETVLDLVCRLLLEKKKQQ